MKIVRCLGLLIVSFALAPCYAVAQRTYAEAYAASTDLREFVDGRASSPKDGSFFYAYWARWECFDDGGIARRIAKEAPPQQGSMQAESVRAELERCRNMPAELSGGSLQREDVQAGRAAGDKLFANFDGKNGSWFYIDDQPGLQRALRLLSPDTDPNMVWVLAQKLAGLAAAQRLTVNGQRLSGAEGRSLYIAFLLGACDLNVDCGRSHRWMRTWCIQNAECDDVTLEGYWRRLDPNRKGKMNWQAIGSYRSLISSAARAGEWSSFVLLPSAER